MLQVVLPPREEAVARRTEALPHGLLVPAADGANLLPVGLQPAHSRRGAAPLSRPRQPRGAIAQRGLGGEVRGALLVQPGQVLGCPREALVLRGLEPPPHGLALRARRERHLLPAGLQLAHPPARRLEVLLGLERLHLLAELFLHLQVRPALPLVGVTQFLHARPERGARGFEPRLQLLPVPLRRQRRAILDRGLDVPQRAVTSLQRHLLGRGERLDLPRNLLEPFQVVLLDLRPVLLVLLPFLLERRDRLLEARARVGIGGGVLPEHVRVASEAAPPGDNLFERLRRGDQLFELRGERLETAPGRLPQPPPPPASLEGAARVLEAPRERRRVLRRPPRKPAPPDLPPPAAVHPGRAPRRALHP